MKKTGLFLILGLFFINAQAKPNLCGYKDFFHFSTDTPPGAYISYASSDVDLYLQVLSPRSFLLYDTPACIAGYADVYVNLDTQGGCVLHIKDGPLMRHPNVQAGCTGNLQYVDIKYDGIGSRSYSLFFR